MHVVKVAAQEWGIDMFCQDVRRVILTRHLSEIEVSGFDLVLHPEVCDR